MTDTSVPKLYLAGFIPGFILTVLFSLTVLIACVWRPHWGGARTTFSSSTAFAAAARLPTSSAVRRRFVVALLIMIGLICAFPEIAMWLPRAVG